MLRFLGVVVVLIVALGGLAYYLGWFAVSTSPDGPNTRINIMVDKEKIKADEEAAKRKLEEAEKKVHEKVKPATSTNRQ